MYKSPLYRVSRPEMQNIGRNGQREPRAENGMGFRRIRLLALLLTHTGQYKVHPTGLQYHLPLDGGGRGWVGYHRRVGEGVEKRKNEVRVFGTFLSFLFSIRDFLRIIEPGAQP